MAVKFADWFEAFTHTWVLQGQQSVWQRARESRFAARCCFPLNGL